MPFEITCGECAGTLLVEAGGVVVECPLCGAHLSIPESAAPGESIPDAVVTEAALSEPTVMAVAEPTVAAEPTPQVAEAGASPHVMDAVEPAPKGPLTDELPSTVEEERLAEEPTQVLKRAAEQLQTTVAEPSPNGEAPTIQLASPPATDALPTEVALTPTPAVTTSQPSSPKAAPKEVPATPAAVEMVPKQWLVITASYASAVTLLLLYVVFFMNRRAHDLESLPDLVPEIRKDGEVGMKRVLPKMNVAPGHELALGESRRFGDVIVTPLRVTKSPVAFVHAFGNPNAKREPSAPVYKLWLKFEHAGSGAGFPPLDAALVFRTVLDKQRGTEFTMNFLSPVGERRTATTPPYRVFAHPELSEYHLEGQRLNHWLEPGQSWETFIPAGEEVTSIEGPWVWRVLFRKGLNPSSGRGVTTLIDVKFSGDDVVSG